MVHLWRSKNDTNMCHWMILGHQNYVALNLFSSDFSRAVLVTIRYLALSCSFSAIWYPAGYFVYLVVFIYFLNVYIIWKWIDPIFIGKKLLKKIFEHYFAYNLLKYNKFDKCSWSHFSELCPLKKRFYLILFMCFVRNVLNAACITTNGVCVWRRIISSEV